MLRTVCIKFINGAARIDSEIMETLWAPLNIILLVARRMLTPYRKECLDFQMNDCNFMKMIHISELYYVTEAIYLNAHRQIPLP